MNDIIISLKSSLTSHAKKIAIDDGLIAMSYEELDHESDLIAQEIRSEGISNEFIGIYLERSKEFIVSILGVLKSGNGYIPLDIQDPFQRVTHIIQNSKMSCLISSSKYPRKFLVDHVILFEERKREARKKIDFKFESCDFAYCIYTSGSSGQPKGVVIKKNSLCNYLKWCISTYTSGSNQGAVVHSSLSYDMSITTLFVPLLLGQTMFIIKDENVSRGLSKLLEQNRSYNLLKLTPSHLKILKETIPQSCLKDKIDNLVIGGEQLYFEDIAFWKSVSENTRFFNEYGPTEATVGCAVYEITTLDKGPVPIGTPIPGAQLLILNENFDPVPLGVGGELFIGGECLANGYLNDHEQTNAKFIDKTISQLNRNFRLYQTGDFVRLLPTKKLMYLSRKDDQLKIRGYRVELAEIVHTLKLHGDLKDVFVTYDKANHTLIAYFLANDFTPTSEELIEFLKDKLPQHMIPHTFILLDQFPLTKNGKVDVAALPSPQKLAMNKDIGTFSPIQQKLCVIWSEVLAKNVYPNDHFFKLGGDSISCILMIGKAKQEGILIDLKDVYKYPTIALLESQCKLVSQSTPTNLAHLQKTFPLTPIQKWFFYQNFKEQNHYNQCSLIKLKHTKPLEELHVIVSRLLAKHMLFFINFKQQGNDWIHSYCDTPQVRISSYKLREDQEPLAQIKSFEQLAQKGLDISSGPLGNILIFESHENYFILLIFHHLIIDWISWGILYRELDELYQSPHLLESPMERSYAEWISSLHQYQTSNQFKQDVLFWNHLRNRQVPKELLFNENKANLPANEIITDSIDEGYTFLLNKVAKESKYKTIDFIISALCLTFSNWYHKDEFYLALESHGRVSFSKDQNIYEGIGWFTSIYPILFDIAKSKGPTQLLQLVHELLESVPMLGIAYGLAQFPSQTPSIQVPSICLNYFGGSSGTHHSSFEVIKDLHFHNISDQNHLPFLININSWIENDQLTLQWFFNHHNFSYKTIEDLSKKYALNLKELIKHFLENNEQRYASAQPHPEKVERMEYSLSPIQQGLLYNAIKSPEQKKYIIQRVFELSTSIDLVKLKKAWLSALKQFDILRNGFIWNDSPRQYTSNFIELNWIEKSVQEECENEIKELLEAEKQKPFDLSKPPLMRFLICKCPNKIYLAWTLHHIVIDGWSTVLVLDHVENAFKKLCQNHPLSYSPIKQFKNYIDLVEKTDQAKLNDFWSKYLHHPSRSFITDLGKALPKSNEPSRYENLDYEIDRELTNHLKIKAKAYGVTLSSIVQCAWALFLHQHLNTDEIIFGITISGRVSELEGIEAIAGVFINTLPLRISLDANYSLKEICQYAHEKTAHIQTHGSISQHEIQSLLKEDHGKDLFDHILVFENFPLSSKQDDKILIPSVKYSSVVETEYPLTIVLMPEDTIKIEMSYSTAFFESTTITHFTNQFIHILSCIALNDEIHWNHLNLGSQKETQNLWAEFNTKNEDLHTSLSQLMANVYPESSQIAIVENEKALSFDHVEKFTNYFAKKLQKECVKKVPVGILLDRSIYFPLAVLSCVKANIPFVPIESKFPHERIRYILNDAKCTTLISSSTLETRFGLNIDCLFINEEYEKANWIISDKVVTATNEDDPAYIIYTSGSSGQPKGVIISRNSLSNYLNWCLQNYLDDNRNGSVLHSSIAFDMSITALFVPFLSRKTLYIVPEGQEINGLINILRSSKKFSFLKLSPSHLKILKAESLTDEINQNIGHLILGGEQLFYEDIASFLGHENASSNLKIFNEYGPTEATVGCAVYKCEKYERHHKGPVPIGRPIFNTQLYALKSNLEPCSILEEGELYIAGMGLSKGYIDETKTAQSFISITLPSLTHEQRMYKTGDRVRLSSNKELIYTGRIGKQVKFNGYRIELEEIEHVLGRHGDIKIAIVDFDQSNQLLKAYFVSGEFVPSLEELQTYLATKLPSYMIPGQYIQVDSIPLNSNGKVDMQALRKKGKQTDSKVNKKPPVTRLEFELRSLWLKLLDRENIGIEDNFFSVGGHSILALRMLIDLQKVFHQTVNLQDFLLNPCIKSLAILLEKGHKDIEFPAWFPFSDKNNETALVLIHPGGGLSYVYALLPTKIGLNLETAANGKVVQETHIDCFAINDPHFGKTTHFNSIEEMAEEYIKIVKTNIEIKCIFLAGWSFGGNVAFEMARQLKEKDGCNVEAVFMFDSFNHTHVLDASQLRTDEMIIRNIDRFLKEKSIDHNSHYAQDLKREMLRNAVLSRKFYPKPFDGNIVLFKAQSDESVQYDYPFNGWEIVTKDVKVEKISCLHSRLFDAENVMEIAQKLAAYLKDRSYSKV